MNSSLVEQLRSIIEYDKETLAKPGDRLTDCIWEMKGIMLNVVTVNGRDLPGQGTMTVTNIHYSRYPINSPKLGIYRFQIEVDAKYWEGKKIAYLQYLEDSSTAALVVEGPVDPVRVNAYIVTKTKAAKKE